MAKIKDWAPGYKRCQIGATVTEYLYREIKAYACRFGQPIGVLVDIALERYLREIEANNGQMPPHVPWFVDEQGDDEYADDDEDDEQGE